jgi:hypothetical protein
LADAYGSIDINGLNSGWMMVEVVSGSGLPQGTYSMVELDPLTCAFARPGGPSFAMSAEEVVHYERMGFLKVGGPVAVNDNDDVAGGDP